MATHAFDEAGPSLSELREAHAKLSEATDSLGELIEKGKFPFSEARDHAAAASNAAGSIHEMLRADGEDDRDDEVTPGDPHGGPTRVRMLGKDIGEVPARATSSLNGNRRDVDHRDDFAPGRDRRPAARGARDEAPPRDYNFSNIMQKE